MRYWKINCTENWYPGLWRSWFTSQCLAVGWPPPYFLLNGPAKQKNWGRARNALKQMKQDDEVVVQLSKNRVARVGTIVSVRAKDNQWNPFVPKNKENPAGEMGRRVLVRWDLSSGPSEYHIVVALPSAARFSSGELLPTIAEIPEAKFKSIKKAVADESNWVSLLGQVGHEVLLSDYIATLPHHLEDGFLPYPSAKVREKVFTKHSKHFRTDVLLIDRARKPVVVECKRGAPDAASVRQLSNYLKLAKKETSIKPRGILVHGGATKLTQDVRSEIHRLRQHFSLEVLKYELRVAFAPCR
jgi:hypothetical protein